MPPQDVQIERGSLAAIGSLRRPICRQLLQQRRELCDVGRRPAAWSVMSSSLPPRSARGRSPRWRAVLACAVTPDGGRVISASDDRTLRVWDAVTGRALATLEGHGGDVLACAVNADDGHIISASEDWTVKLWDLDTYACLFTHRGDTEFLAVAATATGIVAGDASGAVWFLDRPSTSRRELALRVGHGDESQHGQPPDDEPPARRPSMTKHTILFVAANPLGTDRLALDREASVIQAELERAGYRGSFELVTRWAVGPLDLLRELRKLKPTVVHFSGHGGHGVAGYPGPAMRRDIGDEHGVPGSERRPGLYFQGADGHAQLVSTAALAETFGAAGASVKLVVLSACYSELQAEALLEHVDCVVGMGGSTHDDSARNFAIGFYGGLGERESVSAAYKQGRAAISLDGRPDSERPRLKARAGVDVDQLVLASVPRG